MKERLLVVLAALVVLFSTAPVVSAASRSTASGNSPVASSIVTNPDCHVGGHCGD